MKLILSTLILTILITPKLLFSQVFDGYTDKQSYRVNETVTFFLNGVPTTTLDANGNFVNDDVLILFDISGNSVLSISGFSNMVSQSPSSNSPWVDGYGYSPTTTWIVPNTLKSGYYLLDNIVPIIIKGDTSLTGSDIVIVCSTNTDQAYKKDIHYNANGLNKIGMYGEHENNDINQPLDYSPIISFYRMPFNTIPLRLTFMDGFLSWAASTFPANGHSLNVISDQDMDDWGEIANAKLLIIIGHSEYWTRLARLHFDQFVDNGHDAMVLSGNSFWWQVRYQTDPNNAANPQMVCYRSIHGSYPIYDAISDRLLETTSWDKDSLKYSALSSIGSDWLDGGYCTDDIDINNSSNNVYYPGFSGYKITLPNSPLLSGTGLTQGSILSRTTQDSTGELDGTLIKRDASNNPIFDGNGDPILDVEALGFYKAEMIGYDKPRFSNSVYHCTPIIAFQKTCSSGKVINVNSNYWCRPSHFNQTAVQTITDNMINLLLNGSNIWADQNPPTVFELKPNTKTVSYTACADGIIRISPCGVEVTNGYKVDRGDGVLSIGIDNNCTTYSALRTASTQPNKNTTNNISANKNSFHSINKPITNSVTISPNPTTGSFILELFSPISEPAEASIYNTLGVKVQTITTFNQLTQGINRQQINTEQLAPGFYNIQLKTPTQVVNKQFIIQ